MSAQFGRWNFQGQPAPAEYIAKVSATLAPYGPDSDESYSKCGLTILYRAFHTTKEAHREIQPHISPSGAVITWDGRLDNRAELIGHLRNPLTIDSPDLAIVAASYERWHTGCFAKLIGDWALSISDPINRRLILARDPAGVRHLYYAIDENQATWSTILDPLVLFAEKTFEICEEYIAGWLTPAFPAAHLTPYLGIHAVPPSSFVVLRPGKHVVSKYWDFDGAKKIRYRADPEYEEHFRTVFAQAVRRRLRSDRPVLAELSGGMDSSSIVCMADTIIARGEADLPRLDTISWYDDSYDHSAPDWNERTYFSRVEKKRGRTGFHINAGVLKRARVGRIGPQNCFDSKFDKGHFAVAPSCDGHFQDILQEYATCMTSQGNRVVLSGIGGDESTGGGVPTPTPELQNLLVGRRFLMLAHRLKAWSTKMRRPYLFLLWDVLAGFIPLALTYMRGEMRRVPWLDSNFARRNRAAVCGYPLRIKLFGPPPSFQDHMDKLNVNRRLQEYFSSRPELLRDLRFPYLDRDFLEFMFAIPREQVVGIGKRRWLMKRALMGIVPDELLNRKRKAFVPPAPNNNPTSEWPSVDEIGDHIVSSSIGVVNSVRFMEALQKGRCSRGIPTDLLRRTLALESWLRDLALRGVLNTRPPGQKSIARCLPGTWSSKASVRPTSFS